MSKSISKDSKVVTASISDKDELGIKIQKDKMSNLGSTDKNFIDASLNQLISASCKNTNLTSVNGCLSALVGIKPRDELETMLASQMIAVHNLSMEMSRRAILPDQTIEGIDANINRMTKLMRTNAQLVDALQKYRNKGNQKITVQHVQVNDGGKAIIGDIKNKGKG